MSANEPTSSHDVILDDDHDPMDNNWTDACAIYDIYGLIGYSAYPGGPMLHTKYFVPLPPLPEELK
jgi:hypothetical protein